MARRTPKVGGARAGAGRKPAGDEPRTEMARVRLTAAEKAMWTAAASRDSLELSEWLRALARGSTR